MILRAEAIAELLQDKESSDPLAIIPTPKLDDLKKSGSASIDLRLGTWFATQRVVRAPALEIGGSSALHDILKLHYVHFGKSFYLHPGCFVLAMTLEWIRLPKNLAAYITGKSGLGRRGLIIATAASVHPGFVGALTLELSNVGQMPIAIKPGMWISQLCLHEARKGASDAIDESDYVGQSRPHLGRIELDPMASRLADAYKVDDYRPEDA